MSLKRETALPEGPVEVAPGGGKTTRMGVPFVQSAWPKYRTEGRIELLHLLTERPDEYLSLDRLVERGQELGMTSSYQSRKNQVDRFRVFGWVEAARIGDGTARLGFRLTSRALATAPLYAALPKDDGR